MNENNMRVLYIWVKNYAISHNELLQYLISDKLKKKEDVNMKNC